MFITKRKYEEAIHKAKMEVAEQWERKLCDLEKRTWEEQERVRIREDYSRRLEAMEKRILTIEKKIGIAEEMKYRPCEVMTCY